MHTLSCREKEIAGTSLGRLGTAFVLPQGRRIEPGSEELQLSGEHEKPSHKAAVLLLGLDVKGVGGAGVVDIVYGSCQ